MDPTALRLYLYQSHISSVILTASCVTVTHHTSPSHVTHHCHTSPSPSCLAVTLSVVWGVLPWKVRYLLALSSNEKLTLFTSTVGFVGWVGFGSAFLSFPRRGFFPFGFSCSFHASTSLSHSSHCKSFQAFLTSSPFFHSSIATLYSSIASFLISFSRCYCAFASFHDLISLKTSSSVINCAYPPPKAPFSLLFFFSLTSSWPWTRSI